MRRVAPLSLLLALLACEPNPGGGPAPGASPASSSITVTADDATLLIAAEDHDELLVVDRASREVQARIAVGDAPTHVVVLPDGRAVVTNRYSHSISVVDVGARQVVRTVTVGVEPYGLTVLDGRTVAVALAGEEALAVVDVERGVVEKKIDLGMRDPRAVAKTARDGLLVSHLGAGALTRIDVETGFVSTHDVTTFNENGPRTFPNHLRSITLTPDGESALIAHSQANADTVRAPLGEGFDDFGGGVGCGYSGCARELGAVVPAVTEVQVTTGEIIVPVPAPLDSSSSNGAMDREDCFDCGFGVASAPNPPSFLNPFEARFTGVSLNNPTAVLAIDGENGLLVVLAGTKNALLLRRPLRGTADDVIGYVRIGNGASGATLTHDGARAYVWNQFDASITEIEIPRIGARDANATRFGAATTPAPTGGTPTEEFVPVAEFEGATNVLVDDALAPDVSLGRKLFHDATDARISRDHAISCASCHPDGRSDGRTWQFTFGPRNTPQLGGGILDTAPFHWPGDVTTHRELNTMTVLAFMGGAGLDVESMDAIGAFIDTIRAAPPRTALDESLPLAAERGRGLFHDPAVGCASCHAGAHFTNNQNHDIGSQASVNDITSFQTPVLHGLSRSAPYLHDGSAPTLRALVDQWVATDQMGTGSHLSRADLDDLIAYLETL